MPTKSLDRRAYQRAYYAQHIEKRRAYARHWQKTHPEVGRAYRLAHMDAKRQQTTAGQHKRRAWVAALKTAPCVDCGVSYPPCVMEFHHVRGDKLGTISKLVISSHQRLVAELAKCDLLCSNCHSIRHWGS